MGLSTNCIILHTSACIYVNTRFHGYRGITWLQIQSYQFEDWDRVLKIETEVLYELVISFIVLYVSNYIRMLIFTDIEVLLGCKFSPINLRTGAEAPVLKIEKGVLHELVINFIVFYVSNCIRILIFTGIDVLIGCKVSLISLRTGNEPPVLKIAFRGILQLGSVSHRFLRLKLHKSGKFHASINFCTIDVTSDLTNIDGARINFRRMKQTIDSNRNPVNHNNKVKKFDLFKTDKCE